MAQSQTAPEERRKNPTVREIFEEAYVIALPFIDPVQGCLGTAMTRHAYIALHEHFPFLTTQDLPLLVPAIERVFRMRSTRHLHQGG